MRKEASGPPAAKEETSIPAAAGETAGAAPAEETASLALTPEGVRRGLLILVNAAHPLADDFEDPEKNGGLVQIAPGIELDPEAAGRLAEALAAVGCTDEILPVSGYRSRDEQEKIFRDSLEEKGRAFTESFVARPGASEHQTGLAVDLGENKPPIDFICPAFPDRGFCRAFRLAAPDFGFILRYREEKEKITGIAREPWHFRYVGFPHSRIITDRGMALEEYLDFLLGFPFADKPLVYQAGEGTVYRIGYLPAPPQNGAGRTVAALKLPAGSRYSISGDNKAGFIITTKVKKRRGRP